MKRLACATLLALAAPLVAQSATDPLELARLQPVIATALQRIGPSVVRIETFGGARRDLSGQDLARDGIDQPPPLRYSAHELGQLLDRIDPDELGRLWLEAGLEPKPATEPFEPGDLPKLGDQRLRRLFDEYGIRPRDAGPAARPDQAAGFLQAQGATTGVVLTSDGWILVSRFALNFDPSTILVRLADGRSFTATRAGEDSSRGIALVKVEAEGLPVPVFVDPAGLRVGQWAFALGRTFAPSGPPSIHMGIVSAVGRLFGRAVQIDAGTSPANYGGPVIDARGRVLGIAVPLSPSGRDAGVDWYDSGVGFAATIAGLEPLLERMKRGEVLDRGWLGIRLDQSDLGPAATVDRVDPESPAHAAGLQAGDRIVHVDGVQVRNPFHLQALCGAHLAGDPIALGVRRADRSLGIVVTLAAVPVEEREAVSREEETFELPWEGDPPGPEQGR